MFAFALVIDMKVLISELCFVEPLIDAYLEGTRPAFYAYSCA